MLMQWFLNYESTLPFYLFFRREIEQFHFTVWPDKGVPESNVVMASFLTLIRKGVAGIEAKQPKSPLLVHCSAGVGRTGTFIALNELVDEAKAKGA